jgi:opacity protein-like surface antigen
MKKVILTTFSLLAFGIINAQEIKYGLKGGLNVAKLTGVEEGFDARGGFHIGGLVEFKVNEKFFIQPELLFSQQGTKGKIPGVYGSQVFELETTAKYDYLNVSIMAKFYVANDFSLLAGPQMGFLVSAKQKGEAAGLALEKDVKDQYNKVDFGVNFGVGYDFTKNIFAEARYNLGFTDIEKETDAGDVKNRVIQISVGYKF